MILGQEKPSLEDALAHHGVKGMKWGVRKKYNAREIRDARTRQNARSHEIDRSVDKLNLVSGGKNEKKTKAAVADFEQKVNEFHNSKDRAIAARLTRGEKAAMLVIGGPFGAMVVARHARNARKIDKQTGNK